ncbi:MAG: DUF58 domain-containing protein [Planctomycetaceae bacterium]|nr:DUF58 domain-containing protein [Planctomycetaceae bacterium]
MVVRPGVNLIRAALVIAGTSVLGLWFPIAATALVLLLSCGALVLCALDFAALRRSFGTVAFQRRHPQVVGRNLPFEVEWTITGAEPLPAGALRDESPTNAAQRFVFLPFANGHRTLKLAELQRLPTRGVHTLGPAWLRLTGPAACLEAQRQIGPTSDVKVLPEQYASRDELIKLTGDEIALLDKQVFTRQKGAGTEFESLSEYRQGDDPRRIDWRTSARQGRPIVRRYQIERHRDVMIVIDCGRLMGTQTERGSKLDCAVDAGLLLGRVALQGGDRCGLALYDSEVRGYLPPIAGASSINALAECVYAAQIVWRESDFAPMFAALQRRQAKRSLLVIISDLVDAETSQYLRASLLRLQQRHVVLFAALRTSLLDRVIEEPVSTMLDGSRKAVTYRLMREREQALHTLHRAGVFVLDVEPTQLAAPLVNAFIGLRQRNLL